MTHKPLPETCVRQAMVRMLAVARRYLRHAEDRADAVQDAFVAAYRSMPSFKGQSTLWTWLCRVLINTCLSSRRSLSRPRPVLLDNLTLGALEHCGQTIRAVLLRARGRRCRTGRTCGARRRSPRTAFPGSIATSLPSETSRDSIRADCSPAGALRYTVRSRLRRARQALRTLLEPTFGIRPSPFNMQKCPRGHPERVKDSQPRVAIAHPG